MSQNDLDLADQAGASFRSDVNSALQALATLSSGASAPSTTYARMLWADTTTNQLKRRNAANSGWIVLCSLDEAFILSRSSNTILGESDRRKTLIATATFTQTLTAAATLGDGWFIDVIVDSGAVLTVDPNSTETIDGAATKAITGPAQGRIVCNGTLFRTIGFVRVGGLLPSEGISTSATLTAGQMDKALVSSTNGATYTLPDLTADLDGSVVSLCCNAALATGITLAADASDSILDPATGTTGNIVLKYTGETVTVVGSFSNNRWYVVSKAGIQPRAVVQINSADVALVAGSTNYIGNSYGNATETFCQFRAPYKCVARNLYTLAQSGQTGGQTTTYTLRVNAADTALTCVNSSGRNAADTTNSVAIAAGDLISIKVVTSAGATACTHSATVELERVT